MNRKPKVIVLLIILGLVVISVVCGRYLQASFRESDRAVANLKHELWVGESIEFSSQDASDMSLVLRVISLKVARRQGNLEQERLPSGFMLTMVNGFTEGPSVILTTSSRGSIASSESAVESGLRDILGQLCEVEYEVEEVGYDSEMIDSLPLEVFGRIMDKAVRLGTVMNRDNVKPEIGAFKGPEIRLQIDTLRAKPMKPQVTLLFLGLEPRYAVPTSTDSGVGRTDAAMFRVSADTVIMALEVALSKAYIHYMKNRPALESR